MKINNNPFERDKIAHCISPFFFISYLFFQVVEDGVHNVLFKFPDKIFLILAFFSLFLNKFKKKPAIELLSTHVLIILFLLSTLFGGYYFNHFPAVEEKYQPVFYMTFHLISLICLLLASSYNYVVFNFKYVELFFSIISTGFLVSFASTVLGFPLNWGLDLSYGFPRIQGFMIEPSYAGYVFLILYYLSCNIYSKFIFSLCIALTLSLSVYIGVLVYLIIISPRLAIIFLAVALISAVLINPVFFIGRYDELSEFFLYGTLGDGITAVRIFSMIESLNFDYDYFGKGVGSSIYLVGPDSTITPWPALIIYETGFVGFLFMVSFIFLRFSGFNRFQLAISSSSLMYLLINSGNIHIFWVVLFLLSIRLVKDGLHNPRPSAG